MASSSAPRYKTFLSDADLSSSQYRFAKIGTDEQHVAAGTANAKTCGIIMNIPGAAAERAVEVALPGGGGKLEISETVTAGQYLTSTANGRGEVADLAGEHVGAIAQDDGVVGDVIAVEVVAFEAASSDA